MTINVLIADDHTIVRDGLRALLALEPDIHVIGDAANGREAIDRAQELHPDIVLMDIAMPELNGLEATQQIIDTCPGTSVIILSMYASHEHIKQALQMGARGYLLKEAAGLEVVEALKRVQAGYRYLSRTVSERLVDDYLSLSAQHPKQAFERLSTREREVLQLVVEGKTNNEIAEVLHISPKSVGTYRSRLMDKLGITDLAGLVRFAIEHGLTA